MIHLSNSRANIATQNNCHEEKDWKALLRESRINTRTLLDRVGLDDHPLVDSKAESLFELRVPEPYLQKIQFGEPNDPLLLQVLPQTAEFDDASGFSNDPLLEEASSPVKGLIHKYQSRVLLITNQSCAIHCRYCFRRHFPYSEHRQAKSDWREALEYIEKQDLVNEVILSGGDPLTLNNDYLIGLLQQIDALPNIKRIRIHSRLLTTLPQRIDDELLNGLASLSNKLIIVMHSNHPNELGPELLGVVSGLKKLNITLLNQSVLLKGINDKVDTLAELSEKLFDFGILPYYLFTLDKVAGAAHFDVTEETATQLYASLLARLPGFLVPTLAREEPGKDAKTPLNVSI